MKYKILLLSLFVSLPLFSGYSQSLEFTDKTLDKMVLELNLEGSDMFTKEMQQELQLSQEQYQAVERVNKKRFEQLLEAEEAFANSPDQLYKISQSIHSQSDKALFSLLTAEQLKQYLKITAQKEKRYYSVNQQD